MLVRSLRGKTVAIEVNLTESVLALKVKVQDKEGIPADEQRLVYCDKDLRDHQPLGEYGVKSDSTISLRLRVRGGGARGKRARGQPDSSEVRTPNPNPNLNRTPKPTPNPLPYPSTLTLAR